MYKIKNLFSSESVGVGHPDKICDQISDAVLDAYLSIDKNSRVACEVFASNRLIVVGGEITSTAHIDIKKIVLSIVENLGYKNDDFEIVLNVNKQSPDISQCILKNNNEIGAGDQGIVFGYATDETYNYMPLSIMLANEILFNIEQDIRTNKNDFLLFDMKSQVTIDYSHYPYKINTFLVSIQHKEEASHEKIEKYVSKKMEEVAIQHKLNIDFKKIINPSGKFIIGGPIGDTGLTGRKIIVDTYGGVCRHGGGAFSGKDPTKVDRSGAYYARYIAKNLVAAKIAKKCELQISFGIGMVSPIAIHANTFNTSKYTNEQVLELIYNCFKLNISDYINELDLLNVKYSPTAVYGHFGKNDLPWEKLDKVDDIVDYVNKNFK